MAASKDTKRSQGSSRMSARGQGSNSSSRSGGQKGGRGTSSRQSR